MKMTRSTAVAASAVAALAVTGITYVASASGPAAQAVPVAQAAPVVQQAAPVVQQAAPAVTQAVAPADGGAVKGNEGRGFRREREEEGRIHINERTYSAHSGGCITVVSGLGAKSLNIHNDSHSTVEVFRGAVCDNGAPVATVGPHSSSDGVKVHHSEGIEVEDGVVASFRVEKRHHHGGEEHGRGGEEHGGENNRGGGNGINR
ncbi:hypothetical protein ACWCXH_24325 [Kitasatospora sp. NPDC001660]